MNNPKTRQQWIYDLLKSEPTLSFTDCFSKYWGKYSKTEVTFNKDWKIASNRHLEYQEQLNKERERVSIEMDLEPLKSGLKSKHERLLNLQKQVEDCQSDLDAGIKPDYVIIGGKVQKLTKELTPLDKAYIRKTIRDLQSEISKIEGDYAPAKQEHSITSVNGYIIGE